MSYVLAGVIVVMVVVLASCTLVNVDVSSGDEGHSEIHPNGVNVNINKEGQATGRGQ